MLLNFISNKTSTSKFNNIKVTTAAVRERRVLLERRSAYGGTEEDVVTDPSAEWSRMHLCVRILWVAVINPGLICQFTHLAASLQDRLTCLLHLSRLSDSTQGHKLPSEVQTIFSSISLSSKDSPYIDTSLNEPGMRRTICTIRDGCWPSSAHSFLIPSPAGLLNVFYCLMTLGVRSTTTDHCPQSTGKYSTSLIAYYDSSSSISA